MLIIKITQDEVESKKTFFKRRKNETIKRRNLFINNEIHTLVECSDMFCNTDEFKKLLKFYKGKVLVPERDKVKNLCGEYLFDNRPYLKRAVLSSLNKYIKENSCLNSTLCIAEQNFVFYKEYLEIARNVRNLVIVSDKNIEGQKFVDYCFLNMGTLVRFRDSFREISWDLYIDLDDFYDNGKVFIKTEKGEGILYPDPEYFICKNEYKELLSFGISPMDLCSAMELRGDYNVEWHSYNT